MADPEVDSLVSTFTFFTLYVFYVSLDYFCSTRHIYHMENLESQDDFPCIKHSLVHPVPISNMYISYTMYKYSISIIIFILQFAGVSIALSDEVDEKHHKQKVLTFFEFIRSFFF